MKLHFGVLPLIPNGSISEIHRSVQKLFFPTRASWLDGCLWDTLSVFTPGILTLAVTTGSFSKAIKMKGNCPKVWLSVPVWAPRGFKRRLELRTTLELRIAYPGLYVPATVQAGMRRINIYKYEKFIPRRSVQLCTTDAIHEPPCISRRSRWLRWSSRFALISSSFVLHANPVWEWLLSGVVFVDGVGWGAKCGPSLVSGRTLRGGGWAERWEEEQERPSFKSQTFTAEPQLGSILCIYGALLPFVVLDNSFFFTRGAKTTHILYKYAKVWILVQSNTRVKVKPLIQLLYSSESKSKST